MGHSQEAIAAALPSAEAAEAEAGEAFAVLEENWPVLEVFLHCFRRWDRHPVNGRYQAINAPAMESVMRMLGLQATRRAEAFRDLEEMQDAARPILNKDASE